MYKLHPSGIEAGVIKIEEGLWIPACVGNKDWDEYLEWLEADEENQPLPWSEPEM